MRIVALASQGIATVGTLWIGYNMAVLAAIAANKHVDYVPVLHFPIKVFVWALS